MAQPPLARDGIVGQRVIAAGRYRAGTRFRVSPHAVAHGHATLAFYTSGSARVDQHGEWRLGAGDVLLIPAGQPHRMLAQHGAEYWGLGFFAASFATVDEQALLEPFERVRAGAAAVTRIPSERHTYLETLFAELAQIAEKRQIFENERARIERSLLTLISSEVQRALGASEGLPSRSSVVTDALRFIERNCLAPLTLNAVARAVGRNPAYVTSALSRATGRSAVEWITNGRMAEARRLLLHSAEPIAAVAERVGYADATHFIRMFRRAHGATPAQWRALGASGR